MKPRPMKVVFDDEHSKNELLKRSKDLRKIKFKNIFNVQDQTMKERDERKQLMKERDEKLWCSRENWSREKRSQ